MARGSPYPPNAHPGYASREGLPPFVSEGYLGIRRYPGPFKREVKNVVFFIAESRPCVGLIIGGRNVHLRELREVFVK